MLLTALVASHALAAGADHAELDLLRPYPGAPKVYVQAMLSDGEPGLFMVDTGAGVSVIHTALAERLGLTVGPPQGYVTGLGGRVPLTRTVLPSLHLGDVRVGELTVAVGVPGVPTHAGWMPVDGILGNDVWRDFVMVVDYPADVLELHPPGTVALPDQAVPMRTDGSFPQIEASLSASSNGRNVTQELWLEVDTGARGVILSGTTGHGFEAIATEGVEPIYGVGAAEHLPPSSFYRTTRRIPLEAIGIGTEVLTNTGPATWLNYSGGTVIGPQDLSGLLGFSVLQDHRVILDYPGGRFILTDSERPPRTVNGHQVLLDQDHAVHGRSRDRGLIRARYLLGLGEEHAALTELERYLRRHGDDPEARILQARLTRTAGALAAYRAQVDALGIEVLVSQQEIVAAVNLELLQGSSSEALVLADAAVQAHADAPSAWVAQADARLAAGDLKGARTALTTATGLQGNPDAELLRRARVALAEGDPVPR